MKTHCPVRCMLSGVVLSSVLACGGTKPPAEMPTSSVSHVDQGATSSSAPVAANGEGTASKPAAAGEPAPSVAAPSEATPAADAPLERPSRPVRQLLETKDTVFFLSFENSEPGKNAEDNCGKSSGGDPEKNAGCLAKARQPFEGLGYRFTRSPKDETVFTVLRRQGNSLSVLHKYRYTYGPETESATTIKLEGKDEGPVKWEKIAPELKIEVPNDYTIVLHDPKHGRLVYEAKVGIPGE
jgi:hypothetical protein